MKSRSAIMPASYKHSRLITLSGLLMNRRDMLIFLLPEENPQPHSVDLKYLETFLPKGAIHCHFFLLFLYDIILVYNHSFDYFSDFKCLMILSNFINVSETSNIQNKTKIMSLKVNSVKITCYCLCVCVCQKSLPNTHTIIMMKSSETDFQFLSITFSKLYIKTHFTIMFHQI